MACTWPTSVASVMRRPVSWMCLRARQSKFWLPTKASRPSTTKYLAWMMPPVSLLRSIASTVMPGTFFRRSSAGTSF